MALSAHRRHKIYVAVSMGYGIASENPEEINQLNEIWNLIYRSGHVVNKGLQLAKEHHLLKASKEFCSFLEASIGNGRRGPMPFLNSENR